MKVMKRILYILSLVLLVGFSALGRPAGDWKVYSTFNNWHKRVVDTKDKVYLLTLGQPVSETNDEVKNYAEEYSFLFVYDKNADELMAWNSRNYLSDNIIDYSAYNPSKDCLVVVYKDANVDFIYGDGHVVNLPAIKNANLTASKKINDISFDNDCGRAYFAADFGYVVVDMDRQEVVYSLIADDPVLSAGRVGDKMVVLNAKGAFQAPTDKKGLKYSDFTQIDGVHPSDRIMPLSGDKFGYIALPSTSVGTSLCVASVDESSSAGVQVHNWDTYNTVLLTDNGYYIDSGENAWTLTKDGVLNKLRLPDHLDYMSGARHSSCDMKTFWVVEGRKGLRSYRRDGDKWTVTHDYMRPNAPSSFICQDIIYSDRFGAVAASHGPTRQFTTILDLSTPIAAMKNGDWKDYSLAVINPAYEYDFRNAVGLAFDPINPSMVVRGSRSDGIVFVDLDNPENTIKLTVPGHNDGRPGVLPVLETFPNDPYFSGASAPSFDSNGTLWFARHVLGRGEIESRIFFWTAEDRKARKADGVKQFTVSGSTTSTHLSVLAMKASNNKNVLVFVGNAYNSPIMLIDHKGTLTDTSDDETVLLNDLVDQDGNKIVFNFVYSWYEDPQSGLLWVGTKQGLFTLNPRRILSDKNQVANRIKVARNDGTNLADYLLNGVGVNSIAADSQGRKWFATTGGGLVCTSSDGREIIYQLTTENSYLPHDNVYAVCCIPSTNSVLVSTEGGMAEFFPAGSATGTDLDSVKAYPNPVRPDYLGWITIEGLTDGAIVKIMDSMGALVKELGPAEGGVVQWDSTNLSYKRVGSGVYYVLASSGPGDTNLAKVTKILMVR